MSAKLPEGKGVWPAFWLSASAVPPTTDPANDGKVEVDILEYYGFTGLYNVAVHKWKPDPHVGVGETIKVPGGKGETFGFHKYGAEVTPQSIVMYYDRVEVWRTPTPAEHRRKLMMLVNLALGGGWPIDAVKNPSYMEVDYLRAYAPK
jgi:beta-glucanase (GH16 family)